MTRSDKPEFRLLANIFLGVLVFVLLLTSAFFFYQYRQQAAQLRQEISPLLEQEVSREEREDREDREDREEREEREDRQEEFAEMQATLVKYRYLDYVGELQRIPAGTFIMGDLSDTGVSQELPLRNVTMQDYYIGKYEVTVKQFARFVKATGYLTDAERNADNLNGCSSPNPDLTFSYNAERSWMNPGFPQQNDHPVVCVSFNDVHAYIDWLQAETGASFHLPSEAEWEYAARGGSSSVYFFGDNEKDLCEYGNVADKTPLMQGMAWTEAADCIDGFGLGTAPVGSFKPNPYGIHDMIGNVWEWVEDCWNDNYNDAPATGRPRTSTGDCSQHVMRGGSCYNKPFFFRSSCREGTPAFERYALIGFRLVLDANAAGNNARPFL